MSKLSKKDLRNAMLRSMSYQMMSNNYETMTSPGFVHFIAPALEKIYKGKEDLIAEKTQKYLSALYNTQNTMGQIIHGAILALEESEIDGITDTALALRTALMGPFAGLGDSLFLIGPKIIFSSLAGYMALEGSLAGLLLCIVLSLFLNIVVRGLFFMEGYRRGVAFITERQDGIRNLTDAVTIVGLVVVGCMIPSTVKVTTPLVFVNGQARQSIQAVLDSVFPYLLPVLVTFLIYKGLALKKMTAVKMVWLIIGISIVLSFFGIL